LNSFSSFKILTTTRNERFTSAFAERQSTKFGRVVNWLKQFTQSSLRALARINRELLYEQIEQLTLRRLTIDLDGTVIRTGDKVAWAMRGFNPHHPKDPSYYPLLAHLAQTGQILRLKNRPGNVHDSKGVERFVRELIGEIRARLGRALTWPYGRWGCGRDRRSARTRDHWQGNASA